MPAKDDPCVVTKFEKLTPCPKGKTVTVSFPGPLEFLGRLPVVVLIELLFIGDSLAFAEELTDIVNSRALYVERLTHVAAIGKVGLGPLRRSKGRKTFFPSAS